ncbi:hypothetical protein AAVH_26731 [Aphelenchoides avenae]|nr:hypothetical protein AAVH_26731 [Aphelenchus avenae]
MNYASAAIFVVFCASLTPSFSVTIKREAIDASSRAPLYSVALGNVPGKNVTTFLLEYAPGESVPPHRHGSSFVIAYVLEGEVRSQVGDDQPIKAYKAGEWWTEAPGAHHVHASNPSKDKKAKLLAVLVHDSEDTEIFKVD